MGDEGRLSRTSIVPEWQCALGHWCMGCKLMVGSSAVQWEVVENDKKDWVAGLDDGKWG